VHTDLPQIPKPPNSAEAARWARSYGDQLGALYRVDSEVPGDFYELATRIAARCADCDSIADEIDDIIIL
jgi:hypothetical protein